jgi:hypothetical protein
MPLRSQNSERIDHRARVTEEFQSGQKRATSAIRTNEQLLRTLAECVSIRSVILVSFNEREWREFVADVPKPERQIGLQFKGAAVARWSCAAPACPRHHQGPISSFAILDAFYY